MIFLKNDYSLGAHPRIMEALNRTNMEYTDGYGIDPYCRMATEKIRKLIDAPDSRVYFLPGGTLTNITAIAAFLRPHQAVISAETGHICVHETGAIEATGHKIIHVPSDDGKITPEDIRRTMIFHEDEHYVLPKMVYVSNTTETGNVYTKEELQGLRRVCDEYGLLFYLDGARIAMALTAERNNLTLTDFPELFDAFYLGGTKNGILFGEALVLTNPALTEDFRFLLKQRGGMMAKGRLLGVQFNEVFEDNLFLEMGAHANRMAKLLAEGIRAKGYEFAQEPQSNLIFPIFSKPLVEALSQEVMFECWGGDEDTTVIRLVTSWGTREEEIHAFLELI